MDIKARIDKLTETEAKAALLSLLESCIEPLDIDYLDDETIQRERNEDMNYYLDEALKEARDKNFYYPGLPDGDVTTVGNTGDYALKEARK